MKIVVGLRAAAKSRPLSDDQLEAIAADAADFEREITLLTKETAPKRH